MVTNTRYSRKTVFSASSISIERGLRWSGRYLGVNEGGASVGDVPQWVFGVGERVKARVPPWRVVDSVEVGAGGGVAVEGEGLDVGGVGGGGGGGDVEVAGGAVDGDVGEEGAAEDELGAAGDFGVKAEGGEDVPGAHFAEVVVAGDAGGGVGPDRVEDFAD